MNTHYGWCKSCNRLLEPASKTRWEHYQDKISLIEYMKLEKLSILQDIESNLGDSNLLRAKLEEINSILEASIDILDLYRA